MIHFSECSTVAANCKTETQMRDGTVEHFPDLPLSDVRVKFGPPVDAFPNPVGVGKAPLARLARLRQPPGRLLQLGRQTLDFPLRLRGHFLDPPQLVVIGDAGGVRGPVVGTVLDSVGFAWEGLSHHMSTLCLCGCATDYNLQFL